MAFEEPQFRFEKQKDLYKEPKGLEKIDWKTAETDSFTIGKKENFVDALTGAILDKLEADKDPARFSEVQREAKYKANVIFRKAIHEGFNSSLVREDKDEFQVKGGVLYIKTSVNKNWVKLDKDALIDPDFVNEGYTQARPEAIHQSRRTWQSLQEAFKKRILYDVLLALTGGKRKVTSFKNRSLIWEEMKKVDAALMGPLAGETYNGHTPHQKKMLDFLNKYKDTPQVLDQLSKGIGVKFLTKDPASLLEGLPVGGGE